MIDLARTIRDVPDFPKPGIVFKDITTLLKNPEALKQTIDTLHSAFCDKKIDTVIGIESRGFIFGMPLAYKLGVGFIPARKPGKLPSAHLSESFDLEYGTDTLSIHRDAIQPGQQILIVDDLLATGGTMSAVVRLTERMGGIVAGIAFVIELTFLNGIDKLPKDKVVSLIKY